MKNAVFLDIEPCVGVVRYVVSEKRIASIFRVERNSELGR
jgi:hypothetical protein